MKLQHKHWLVSLALSSFLCFSPCILSASTPHNYLEEISRSFTEIAQKALPAGVFIKVESGELSPGGKTAENYESPFEYFSDEIFRRFFGAQAPGFRQNSSPSPSQISAGSGFLVSTDGYIVTNHHVIKDASRIIVVLNSGEELPATIVGTDIRTDLAVLKIEGKNLPYLKFGDSRNLKIGSWAIAIGNPFALQSSFTVGVVSATRRNGLKITDLEDFIQTDAAINPGNSGGPLLNIQGEVIGVNTAIFSRSGGYHGIGFAIPSSMAEDVVNKIIQTGSVKRGYLGAYLQAIDKEMAEALNLDKTEGVLIAEVTKGSPAEKAGLKQGDILLTYNGSPIKSMSQFRNEIALLNPGTKIQLGIIRNGSKETIPVTLSLSPEEEKQNKVSTQLGIDVTEPKDLSPDLLSQWGCGANIDGVIITRIIRGSIAERADLQVGMEILQLNQKKIKSLADFNEALQNESTKKNILLLVRFHNMTRFVSIRIK